MSEITLSLEHPSLGCGEIIARYDLSEIQEKAYQQGRADEHEKVVQRISEILSLEIADCKNCPINCEVATYGSCQEELKKYLLEQIGAEMKLNKWLINDVTAQAYKDGIKQGTDDTVDKAIELLKEYPLVTAMGKIKELKEQIGVKK